MFLSVSRSVHLLTKNCQEFGFSALCDQNDADSLFPVRSAACFPPIRNIRRRRRVVRPTAQPDFRRILVMAMSDTPLREASAIRRSTSSGSIPCEIAHRGMTAPGPLPFEVFTALLNLAAMMVVWHMSMFLSYRDLHRYGSMLGGLVCSDSVRDGRRNQIIRVHLRPLASMETGYWTKR